MPDYVFTAKVKLRVKGEEDFLSAADKAEDFFSNGLHSLAYSDDENDAPYEIESTQIDWGATQEW